MGKERREEGVASGKKTIVTIRILLNVGIPEGKSWGVKYFKRGGARKGPMPTRLNMTKSMKVNRVQYETLLADSSF